MFRTFASLLVLFFMMSCGDARDANLTEFFSAVIAEEDQDESELGLEGNNHHQLSITLKALQTPFLMSMSVIPQRGAATSSGLAAKVVQFIRFGDTLDMYELNDGNVVTDFLPAQTLLAQFPIVSEDKESVTIDFGKGMADVYTSGWYDASGIFISSEKTLDIRASRVFEVQVAHDRLMIRHAVLSRNTVGVNAPVEMRYYFSRYQKSDFVSKEIGLFRNVGYFATPTKLEKQTGRQVKNTIRFDLQKPIVFHYSSNTPADYVDAVKDGILYWNKAFGQDIVKAEAAPQGVSAPDPRHNIVQWVEWDEAGFAYADVLADPLTGQALHGQVYMTSVFAFRSVERARRLLRTLSSQMEEVARKEQTTFIMPKFAESHVSCDKFSHYEGLAKFKNSLESLLMDTKLTEDKILEISQDYVREVIAHEIGHVLGLRHNFSASNAGNMTPMDKKNWLEEYIKGEAKIDSEKYPVSSVMEYAVPLDAYYVGWYIREAKTALPYDKGAIQWGYFDDETIIDNKTLFCTDDHVSVYLDCNRFEEGPSAPEVVMGQMADMIRSLPATLIENIIAEKTAYHPSAVVPVRRHVMDPELHAREILMPLASVIQRFNSASRIVATERKFDHTGALNKRDILEARHDALVKGIENAGGIDQVLFAFLPLDLSLNTKDGPKTVQKAQKISAASWMKKFEALLESEQYAKFIGGDGKEHSFSDEEKTYLKSEAKRFFSEIERKIIHVYFSLFDKSHFDLKTKIFDGVVQEDDVAHHLQKRLAEVISKVVLTYHSEQRITGTLSEGGVWVKTFAYPVATRELAASLFSSVQGNYDDWAVDSRKAVGERLKKEVSQALNSEKIKDFKASLLSPNLRQWYKEQEKVAAKLQVSL